MVYFSTKELYELSKYKGIKYFRQAFLFFALAYFFRSFIRILLPLFGIERALGGLNPFIGALTLFLFMYFSSMAVFYLLYSVMCKKWNGNRIYLFHILAFFVALFSTLLTNPFIYFLLNIVLFIFVAIVFYISHKQSKTKKGNSLYIIYMLLFIFWILNILDILIPDFIQLYQLFIYLASTGIFLAILYKVLKKAS